MASGEGTVFLNVTERQQILGIINQAINRVQRRKEELSIPEQKTVIDQINKSMASHASNRDELAKWIAKSWTFLQYSHVCILVHHFGNRIDGGIGVSNYLRMNPTLSNLDTHGKSQGAAENSSALKEHCHMIQEGGAVTPKFPRLAEFSKWVTEEQMLLCEQQFKGWQKDWQNRELWKRPDMDCALWCPSMEWNAQDQRWQKTDTWGMTPAKVPLPEISSQTGASKPGTPSNQISQHSRVNSHGSTGFLQAGGSRPGTPLGQLSKHSRVNSHASISRESKH